LGVVLLSIDATRLLIRFVLQVGTFARSDDTIGFRAGFDTHHMRLACNETAGFGACEFAARHSVVDALALVMFALVEARRARCCGTRKSQRKGETNASQEGRGLHAHLL